MKKKEKERKKREREREMKLGHHLFCGPPFISMSKLNESVELGVFGFLS